MSIDFLQLRKGTVPQGFIKVQPRTYRSVELIERLCREPITADTISRSILYRLYALENIGICSARFIKKSNLIIKEFALTEPVRQVLSTIFRLQYN